MRIASLGPLCSFLFLLLSFQANGQAYRAYVTHYGVDKGLSHREVNAVFQDRDGHIWLGAKFGLNRFDGYDFKWFTKDASGNEFNAINQICQDKEGLLWLFMGRPGGDPDTTLLLDPSNDQVITLAEYFTDGFPVQVNQLNANILRGKDGSLFFSTKDRATLIHHDSQGPAKIYPIAAYDSFRALAYSSQNTIWGVADERTILELSARGEVVNSYLHEHTILPSDCFLRRDTFWFTQEESKYQRERFFYVIPGEGIRAIGEEALPKSLHRVPNFQRIRYSADRDLFWLLHDNQLKVIKPGEGVLFELTEENPDLRSSFIRGWEVDAAGRTWIGGNFGVYIIDVQPNRFTNYLAVDIEQDLFYPHSCRGMIVQDSQLLVNTESSGLFQIDLKNGEHKKIDREEKDKEFLGRALHRGSNGKIWIGKNRLVEFDLEKRDSTVVNFARKNANDLHIWSIFQEDDQLNWLGTEEGLYWYQLGDSLIQDFRGYGRFYELAYSFILHIGTDRAGDLWICANTGLYQLNREGQVIGRYWRGGRDEFYLPAENFQHFYQDEAGIYWLATAGSGLIRWDKANDKYRSFTRNEGLSHNNIYAVYEGVDGQLWMSSDFGIMRFDKNSYNVNTYLRKDGVSHHEFNRIAHLQDTTGRIYFGSLNGLTTFDPADFSNKNKPSSSKMAITGFQQFVSDENLLIDRKKELLKTRQIIMEPGDPFFLLEFALLSFENVEKILYRYKIENIDQDWTEQKERSIRLSRLPYGQHTLLIGAQAASGEWVRDRLKIKIVVKRPLYLKNWFLGLCALLIIAGIYSYIKWRSYEAFKTQQQLQAEVNRATTQILEDKETIEQQAEELRQLDKVKSRFFANVSHELRTPLTLMLGPLSSVLKSKNLSEQQSKLLSTAKASGHQLLNLINEILDLSRLESGKLEVKEHPTMLFSFVRKVVSSFQAHAERNEVYFELDYQADKDLQVSVDNDKLEKIINNFLSNAFKFTGKGGQIKVVVEDLANQIQLRVKDTGRGIATSDLPHVFKRFYQSKQPDAPTEGGTGIGLALCSEFAELMNGRLWVESTLGQGSTFYFVFPRKEIIGIEEVALEASVDDLVASNLALASEQPLGSKASILIIEDNHNLREYLQLVLSSNYHVQTAENGQVAMDLLNADPKQATNVDLIISDLMMPVMDGYQFATELKANATWRQLPLIMLTARADSEDRHNALRIGVDDYMIKPFEEDELMARVKHLLHNSQLRRSIWKEDSALESSDDSIKTELAPSIPMMTDEEQKWLTQLEETIIKELSSFGLTAEQLASLMTTSRGQLFKKIRKLTGLTFSQYILEIRLTEARSMLENKDQTSVKAVAYAVGLKQVKHFSQLFKKRFGKSPSHYLNA
ncbi:MAG: ATP-binding protein [Bacteroidota bacterium]